MTTSTHLIAELQREIAHTREEVLRLTGISLEKQDLLFVEAGLDWIEMITQGDRKAMELMPKMREFWGFWKKQWLRIDLQFIQTIGPGNMSRTGSAIYYEGMHRISYENKLIANISTQAHYHIIRKHLIF